MRWCLALGALIVAPLTAAANALDPLWWEWLVRKLVENANGWWTW